MTSKFPVTSADGIAPAALPGFKAKYNQNWGLQSGEGDQDLPGNELNNPVDLRKGNEPANGWLTIASDIQSDADGFSKGDGGEKR
jgi:hypothetical protein